MEKDNCLIGFVILHYRSKEDTIKCVNSIRQRVDAQRYKIVIVDNASPDGSGNELKLLYADETDISVHINNTNLGFASGNNVGFKIAKYEYRCDFICMTNSDTYLIQDDFFNQIILDYQEYQYYVLGPYVVNQDIEAHCNPMGTHLISYKESVKKIRSLQWQLLFNRVGVDEFLRKVKCKIVHSNVSQLDYKQYHIDAKLHGCCLIFSPLFVHKYDGLIEGTFLYLEEELLYIQMMNENQKMLYSPNVRIFHSEDASTDKIAHGRKKRRFILVNHLHSMERIRDYLFNLSDNYNN